MSNNYNVKYLKYKKKYLKKRNEILFGGAGIDNEEKISNAIVAILNEEHVTITTSPDSIPFLLIFKKPSTPTSSFNNKENIGKDILNNIFYKILHLPFVKCTIVVEPEEVIQSDNYTYTYYKLRYDGTKNQLTNTEYYYDNNNNRVVCSKHTPLTKMFDREMRLEKELDYSSRHLSEFGIYVEKFYDISFNDNREEINISHTCQNVLHKFVLFVLNINNMYVFCHENESLNNKRCKMLSLYIVSDVYEDKDKKKKKKFPTLKICLGVQSDSFESVSFSKLLEACYDLQEFIKSNQKKA
jgi:hypothetical protein